MQTVKIWRFEWEIQLYESHTHIYIYIHMILCIYIYNFELLDNYIIWDAGMIIGNYSY